MVSYGFPIKTSIFPWFSYGIILGFVHGQNPLDVENRKRGKALEHDRRGTRTGLEPHRTVLQQKTMEQWWDFMVPSGNLT